MEYGTPDVTTRQNSFVGDVLKLTGGAVFAQALGLLITPILSRLFAPEAFGTAAIFGSLLQVCTVVVCLRYELAIMLPEKDAVTTLEALLALAEQRQMLERDVTVIDFRSPRRPTLRLNRNAVIELRNIRDPESGETLP